MKTLKHIKNWQRHIITDDAILVAESKRKRPDIEIDKIMVLTGTIIEDSSGRFSIHDHTRTTIVTKITTEKAGFAYRTIYETANTVYIVHGPEGDDVIGGGDWGKNVMKIFY